MRKSIFTVAILFSLFSLVFSSCSKDDSESGTYKLVMDGNIVAEGTLTEKVLMLDNTINMGGSDSDFVITITNVPEAIDGNIAIDLSSGSNGDNCQLTISGKNMLESGADEIYWGKSGTVTRTSATKISYEGTCQPDASGTVIYTFSGEIESDVFEVN